MPCPEEGGARRRAGPLLGDGLPGGGHSGWDRLREGRARREPDRRGQHREPRCQFESPCFPRTFPPAPQPPREEAGRPRRSAYVRVGLRGRGAAGGGPEPGRGAEGIPGPLRRERGRERGRAGVEAGGQLAAQEGGGAAGRRHLRPSGGLGPEGHPECGGAGRLTPLEGPGGLSWAGGGSGPRR